LEEILISGLIRRASNPDIPTFKHPKGYSTLDYIFTSRNLEIKRTETKDLSISDHSTLGVVIRVPTCLSSGLLREEKKKRLDFEQCARDLDNLRLQKPTAFNIDESAAQIVETFNANSTIQQVRKTPKNKPWFSNDLRDLRDDMLNQLRAFHVSGDNHDAGIYA